jgi:hypothetical protein
MAWERKSPQIKARVSAVSFWRIADDFPVDALGVPPNLNGIAMRGEFARLAERGIGAWMRGGPDEGRADTVS